jgi:hypothetical protein
MSSVGSFSGIEIRNGTNPIVVFAPHGGRRRRPVKRGDSVNDLHTADVADELARCLDAHALINRDLDRNTADLNRVSALGGECGEILASLRRVIESAGASDPVLVLIVHGWNVTMPACDLGVGLVEREGRLSGAHPTLSRRTFEGFVRRLADELGERGIDAPIGRRYPASARDNATQIFSGRHAGHDNPDVAFLSTLAQAGGIDAVQLELAIPLRWPGTLRDSFIEVLAAAARRHIVRRNREVARAPRSEWSLRGREAAQPARMPPGWSLQAAFADGGGLFAGAEPTGPADAAARLCLVRPDGRMLLFVGEGPWEGDENRHSVGGFELEAQAGSGGAGASVRLRYRGPMVIYPTHDAFCDLEEGLAGAELTSAESEVELEVDDESFARVRGYLRTGEGLLDLQSVAVCERGSRRGGSARARSRVVVTDGPWAFARAAAEDGDALEWRTDDRGEIHEIGVALADGRAGLARVLTRVPVYRVVGNGVAVKVTFGTAALRPTASASDSLALFERVEIVSAE